MDLTTSYPRSVRDEIAGVVMLARTADKAKAKTRGDLGEYHYDCPMDQAVFGFLGIDQAAFLKVAGDAAVASFVEPYVAAKAPAEIAQWNAAFLSRSPEPGSESATYFERLRSSVAPDRTDVVAWADLLDLDEKRPVPVRAHA